MEGQILLKFLMNNKIIIKDCHSISIWLLNAQFISFRFLFPFFFPFLNLLLSVNNTRFDGMNDPTTSIIAEREKKISMNVI